MIRTYLFTVASILKKDFVSQGGFYHMVSNRNKEETITVGNEN